MQCHVYSQPSLGIPKVFQGYSGNPIIPVDTKIHGCPNAFYVLYIYKEPGHRESTHRTCTQRFHTQNLCVPSCVLHIKRLKNNNNYLHGKCSVVTLHYLGRNDRGNQYMFHTVFFTNILEDIRYGRLTLPFSLLSVLNTLRYRAAHIISGNCCLLSHGLWSGYAVSKRFMW